jgi:hypothetical protein
MLDDKRYLQTYKENEILKAENKAMYILAEENKDLKNDLDGFKNINYD